MTRFVMGFLMRILALMAMTMFVLPYYTKSAQADEIPAIKIKHKPIKYYVPEKRIRLETKVKSKGDISKVRCYFKGDAQADYVFVPMAPGQEGAYEVILPAPSKNSKGITYLFLVVTGDNSVVRTQEYSVSKSDQDQIPSWQKVESKDDIHVSTELATKPESIEGFTDSIIVDVVESAVRFGYVAEGIYISSKIAGAGGTSGAAAAATSSGVLAASAGVSGAAIAAGVVAGAAVVAGGATVVKKASEDDDCEDISGRWSGRYNGRTCRNRYESGSFYLNLDDDCSFSGRIVGSGNSGDGTLSVSGNNFSFSYRDYSCGTVRVNGNISNNDRTMRGTYSYSRGRGGTFYGER